MQFALIVATALFQESVTKVIKKATLTKMSALPSDDGVMLIPKLLEDAGFSWN